MSFIHAGCVFKPMEGCITCGFVQTIPCSTLCGFYIYTSHLQGHTPVFSWDFILGYSLCFFPSVLYLQEVHSGEFVILMHRVYKHYKHLKPPLLFFCYIPHGCNMCALRAQSDFSRWSKSGIEKSKIKVSGGPPHPRTPHQKDGFLRKGCRRGEAACGDLLQQADFLIGGMRGHLPELFLSQTPLRTLK